LIFTFNKEIILKDVGQKGSIEITVHLTTEKGNNILAGSVKIETAELSIHQGQNLTVSLSNCLDSTAKCHLKIFRVKNAKMRRDNNRFRAASGISSIRGEVN